MSSQQDFKHVPRILRGRKHPPAILEVQRQADPFKKHAGLLGGKAENRVAQKSVVWPAGLKEISGRQVVGYVAVTAACDEQLSGRLRSLFDVYNAQSSARSLYRSHHRRRPAARDAYITFYPFILHSPHNSKRKPVAVNYSRSEKKNGCKTPPFC